MSAELFVPKLNLEKPSLPKRAVLAARSFLNLAKYEEIYGELHYPAGKDYPGATDPAKAVLKNGQVIAVTRTFSFRRPQKFIDRVYTPDFAEGECIDISDGDYKTVLIDKAGQSDTVIKRYGYHTYWGEYAKERAETAATKLNQIYSVVSEICPQHILPTERFVYPMPYLFDNQEGWAVFERQQRAIFFTPWLSETPQAAEKLEKDAERLSHKYHKKIVGELLRRGICQRDPAFNTVDFSEMCFGLRYDSLTGTLVADDIIDYVSIKDPRFNA